VIGLIGDVYDINDGRVVSNGSFLVSQSSHFISSLGMVTYDALYEFISKK
jgi:hypothetical protein